MWKLIAVPIVGAIIGYATNWIAVKMLFRPYREVRLFGILLPFTPGVIPRGQGRLARAVGKAVEDQLLTKEVLEEVLLSEETKKGMKTTLDGWVKTRQESEKTLRQAALEKISEETYSDVLDSAQEDVTEYIYQKIIDMELGERIAGKVLEVAKQKLSESMFGKMLGSSFLDPIAAQVKDKIDEYLVENGKLYVEQMVMEESEKLQEKTVGSLFLSLKEHEVDLSALLVDLYVEFIKEKLAGILQRLHLADIVENRINAMKVEEVEVLLLSIMKKELGTIVNLGALIGFVLGLVNVGILCL